MSPMPAKSPRDADSLVSVIMPAYNAEEFIPAAIESILAQTHPHFEFLICNDGSTDGTGEICDAYAAQDARIRVFHQPNRGIAFTTNRLLREAQYDRVAFLDNDDLMLPTRLERQLAFWQAHPGLLFSASYVFYVDASGRKLGGNTPPWTTEEQVQEFLRSGELVWVQNTSILCLRQAALEAGGFPEHLVVAGDGYLWNTLARRGHFLVQPEFLTCYRIHTTSTSVRRLRATIDETDWIEAVMRARAANQPEPTMQQVMTARRQQPFFVRLQAFLAGWAVVWYKQAVIAWAARSPMLPVFAALAFFCWPPFVWKKVAHRRLQVSWRAIPPVELFIYV